MRFKRTNVKLEETQSSTDLKLLLVQLCALLNVKVNIPLEKIDLHHRNGVHDSSTLINLCLMEHGSHSQYHKILKQNDWLATSADAQELLNLYVQRGKCVLIGKMLLSAISSIVMQDEQKVEKEVVS